MWLAHKSTKYMLLFYVFYLGRTQILIVSGKMESLSGTGEALFGTNADATI